MTILQLGRGSQCDLKGDLNVFLSTYHISEPASYSPWGDMETLFNVDGINCCPVGRTCRIFLARHTDKHHHKKGTAGPKN